ncbi:hypothetical protein AAG570_008675 [Ranatra chinensis]|uniref:Uncharacterized protein n=1 Tax=Ranatra chinensis TaxID=642074 RepID=A0ABD0Z2A2_9HEMI
MNQFIFYNCSSGHKLINQKLTAYFFFYDGHVHHVSVASTLRVRIQRARSAHGRCEDTARVEGRRRGQGLLHDTGSRRHHEGSSLHGGRTKRLQRRRQEDGTSGPPQVLPGRLPALRRTGKCQMPKTYSLSPSCTSRSSTRCTIPTRAITNANRRPERATPSKGSTRSRKPTVRPGKCTTRRTAKTGSTPSSKRQDTPSTRAYAMRRIPELKAWQVRKPTRNI